MSVTTHAEPQQALKSAPVPQNISQDDTRVNTPSDWTNGNDGSPQVPQEAVQAAAPSGIHAIRITPFREVRSVDGYVHYVYDPQEPESPLSPPEQAHFTGRDIEPTVTNSRQHAQFEHDNDTEKGILMNQHRTDSAASTVHTPPQKRTPIEAYILITMVTIAFMAILGTLIPAVVRSMRAHDHNG